MLLHSLVGISLLSIAYRFIPDSWFMISWLRIVLWKSRSPLVIPLKFHSPPQQDPKLHYESLMKGWNQCPTVSLIILYILLLHTIHVCTILTGILIALPSAPAQDWIKASSKLHRLAQVAWRGVVVGNIGVSGVHLIGAIGAVFFPHTLIVYTLITLINYVLNHLPRHWVKFNWVKAHLLWASEVWMDMHNVQDCTQEQGGSCF